MYYVYILRCSDRSLHVGQTCNIRKRVQAHNAGFGAAFTFKLRPVKLAYVETHPTRTVAMRRERQLKGWTREKKSHKGVYYNSHPVCLDFEEFR